LAYLSEEYTLLSRAENGGDLRDDDDDANPEGFFLGTNALGPEWCRAKTEGERKAHRSGRRAQQRATV